MDRSEPSSRRRRTPPVGAHDEHLAAARRRLLQQAFVFDDPAAYAAGVEDAFAAMTELSLGREATRANADGRAGKEGTRVPVRGAAR